MLHRQDYLLRLIEQMGQLLVRVRNQLLHVPLDELPDVDSELNGLAQRAGLDLELARRLDPDSLGILIAPIGEVDPGRCWLLAELLFLHGVHAERRGDRDSARQSFSRSLHLFSMVEPEWSPLVDLPPAGDRIRELRERLDASPTDPV